VSAVVSVVAAVVSVVLEVVGPSVELVVDELVEGSVVLVVEVVVVAMVVVRLGRTVLVGGVEVVVGWWYRLVRGTATGRTPLDGGTRVAVACALRCRPTVVAGERGSAWARWRGVVTKPTRLPPMAPISTAATSEFHRRDSTKRIGLKTGFPPDRASLTR
jgi:hypothetical protein